MPVNLPCPLALSCDCRITRDRLGNYSGAVEDFSAALLLDNRNADFYHNRGFSQRKQVLTRPSVQSVHAWHVSYPAATCTHLVFDVH